MDERLRELERAYRTSMDDADLERFANECGRRGVEGWRYYREQLLPGITPPIPGVNDHARDLHDLERYFWRRGMVASNALEVVQPLPIGVGLIPGDIMERRTSTGRLSARYRVVEVTGGWKPQAGMPGEPPRTIAGGRVRVRRIDRGRWHEAPRRGNRLALWMGSLAEPMDPRRYRALLNDDGNTRLSPRLVDRERWRASIRGLLLESWCLGASEEETRSLLTAAHGRARGTCVAMWLAAADLTGWPLLKKSAQRKAKRKYDAAEDAASQMLMFERGRS